MKIKVLAIAFAMLLACSWSGAAHAARFFVDNALGDVPPEQAVTVADPKPVQLLIEFKTNGAPNAQARRFVTPIITRHVTESGYFSNVSTSPVEGGAILSIVVDNIFDREAARRAGFETGSSFFLNGNAVSDNYVATVEYVGGANAATIRKETRHMLITAIGRVGEPENATRARNAEEALNTVMRQITQRLLRDTVADPVFSGAPPATTDAATPTDPAAAPDAATTAPPAEATPQPEAQPAPAN